jgi:hypothetical protein
MYEEIRYVKIVCLVLGAVLLGVMAFNIFGSKPTVAPSCGENIKVATPNACYEVKPVPTK